MPQCSGDVLRQWLWCQILCSRNQGHCWLVVSCHKFKQTHSGHVDSFAQKCYELGLAAVLVDAITPSQWEIPTGDMQGHYIDQWHIAS